MSSHKISRKFVRNSAPSVTQKNFLILQTPCANNVVCRGFYFMECPSLSSLVVRSLCYK